MFDKKYEFDNVAIGFYTLDDEVTTIYKEIMYYENNIKKKSNDIQSEIEKRRRGHHHQNDVVYGHVVDLLLPLLCGKD